MKFELFPTLVKEYNVSGYPQKEKLLERISSYPTRNHNAVKGGVSSFNPDFNPLTNNFLTSEGFNDLYNYFLECSFDYSKEVGIDNGKMANSWFNVMEHRNETIRHCHPGSIIAGAYYPLLEDNSCNLIFYSPHFNYQQTWFKKIDNNNPYSTQQYTMSIKQDHLYLFPGWLEHGTEVNKSQKRIVISFNITPWA